MAPPQSSMSLQDRLLQLAQTLQHLLLLISIVSYSFSYITFNYYSPLAIFSYRTAFLSAAATYGIVVYKAFRARARATGRPVTSPITFAADENVQYLSNQYPLAMLPFGVYSIFHVATYTRTVLVPTFEAGSSNGSTTASKPNSIADTIGRFVKRYYDASMGLVAILEISLWGRILLSSLTFSRGSWILLAIYTIFLRARYAQSTFVQIQFRNLEARIDSLIGAQSTPPAARQAWDTLKEGIRTFHDSTSFQKYTGAGPSAPKKAT
ncbi:Nucleoporin POM33 [Erysiphe neolycopersici]|uniref:Nucleoporin POM33 n=1 Tax=Erysiphe neolycopersici TaxID=212602 RepID=A0A420I284_9PEZI|nr:Nucleoporin POM33 [Erysiphe neolycopersici]